MKKNKHFVIHPLKTGKLFKWLLVFVLALPVLPARADSITLKLNGVTLEKVLVEIQRKSGYDLIYKSSVVAKFKNREVDFRDLTVGQALARCLAGTGLIYEKQENSIVIYEAEKPMQVDDGEQKTDVYGIVRDEQGEPMAGVTVLIKGTTVGTATDGKGRYRLSVPLQSSSILVFSFVGMETQEVKVGKQQEVNVVLKSDHTDLDEVVVTGYSVKKTGQLTGSVVKISGEALTSSVSTPSILSSLKGKTSGMYIVENAGDVKARGEMFIRGQSTLPDDVGEKTPLIVLDGVVMGNVDMQTLVSPSAIESLTVLKDAASTAIYGSRAALGVIVITTKKGQQQGTSVSADAKYGISQYTSRMRLMNTKEWIRHVDRYLSTQYEESMDLKALYATEAEFLQASKIYSEEEAGQNFNWDKALYDQGKFYDIAVGLRAGTAATRLYGNAGWYSEKGIRLNDKLDRLTLKLNTDFDITKELKVSLLVSVVVEKTTQQNGIPEPSSYLPFYTPWDKQGKWRESLSYRTGSLLGGMSPLTEVPNVLAEADRYDNTAIDKSETYMGTFNLSYSPLNNLTLQTSNTFRRIHGNTNSYYDPRGLSGRYGDLSSMFGFIPYYADMLDLNGSLNIADTRSEYFLTSNTVQCHEEFGEHQLSFMGGVEFSKMKSENSANDYYDLLSDERNAGAAKQLGGSNQVLYGIQYLPTGNVTETAMFSAFGELNYNWLQKYFATTSVRTDASSSFGRNKRYGVFYSLSAAWLLHKEKFMEPFKAIHQLKLRYAYGTSGRDLGAVFLNKTFYSNTYGYNGVAASGAAISQVENPDISWETTYNNTLGVEVGLFKRLHIVMDLYHKRSANLIQTCVLPATMGGFNQKQNIGEVVNKGLELTVDADLIRTSKVKWDIGVNLSMNRNKITKLAQDSLVDNLSKVYYRHVGEDINVVKAIKYVGVNPENGAPLFENFDADGNKIIVEGLGDVNNAANYQKVGTATPKVFGGIQTGISYTGFHLSMEFFFQLGPVVNNGQVLNALSPSSAFEGGSNCVVPNSAMRIWSGPGDTKANLPNIYSSKMGKTDIDGNAGWDFYNYNYINSAIWQRNDHLRLRNIRLSYDIPSRVLEKIGMQSATVYVSADNVFVIKKKNFWAKDPESAFVNDSRYMYRYYFSSAMSVVNPFRISAGMNLVF